MGDAYNAVPVVYYLVMSDGNVFQPVINIALQPHHAHGAAVDMSV